MNVKRKIEILLLVLGGCMLAAALGLLFYFHWQDRRAGAAADELTGQVEAVLEAEEKSPRRMAGKSHPMKQKRFR